MKTYAFPEFLAMTVPYSRESVCFLRYLRSNLVIEAKTVFCAIGSKAKERLENRTSIRTLKLCDHFLTC